MCVCEKPGPIANTLVLVARAYGDKLVLLQGLFIETRCSIVIIRCSQTYKEVIMTRTMLAEGWYVIQCL